MRDQDRWTLRSLSLTGAAALAIVLAQPAPAQAEWCGSNMEGFSTCGFSTRAQCMAAMSGMGGYCNERGGTQQQQQTPASQAPRRKDPEPKKKPPQ